MDTALAQLAGGLSQPLQKLRLALLSSLAHLEAGLDFADEDIDFISAAELDDQLATAAETTARLAEQMQDRADASDIASAVLLGLPNVGKSSLFNALADAEGAIVSSVPGTTRDYLTARIDLDGVPLQLIDTAGVEEPALLASADRRDIATTAQAATLQQTGGGRFPDLMH